MSAENFVDSESRNDVQLLAVPSLQTLPQANQGRRLSFVDCVELKRSSLKPNEELDRRTSDLGLRNSYSAGQLHPGEPLGGLESRRSSIYRPKDWINNSNENMINVIEQQQRLQHQQSQHGGPTSPTAATSPGKRQQRPPPRKPNLNANFRPPRALFCLTLNNPLRKFCIKICEYKWVVGRHFESRFGKLNDREFTCFCLQTLWVLHPLHHLRELRGSCHLHALLRVRLQQYQRLLSEW